MFAAGQQETLRSRFNESLLIGHKHCTELTNELTRISNIFIYKFSYSSVIDSNCLRRGYGWRKKAPRSRDGVKYSVGWWLTFSRPTALFVFRLAKALKISKRRFLCKCHGLFVHEDRFPPYIVKLIRKIRTVAHMYVSTRLDVALQKHEMFHVFLQRNLERDLVSILNYRFLKNLYFKRQEKN